MENAASNDQPRDNQRKGAEPAGAPQSFPPLTANFTEVPNEIWDLRMPGLTPEIRWTLLFVARETVGRALERGGSPYDFAVVPWDRWLDVLDLPSTRMVKERLAKMEAMGLIETRGGDEGGGSGQGVACRLRWVDGGKPTPRTYRPVNRGQA